jgi:hypothetical protein
VEEVPVVDGERKESMMNVETYAVDLQKALGENLCSVILYGSAAGTDFNPSKSDLNLLVLCRVLGPVELKTAANVSEGWVQSGQPWPLFMTRQSLMDSADVFPIEMFDIRESRRVLMGEDVPALLDIRSDNLRHQLEFELKSKLIRLRGRYLILHRDPQALLGLMLESRRGFLVLFRALLRLLNEPVPASKNAALQVLAGKWSLDASIFPELDQLEGGAVSPGAAAVEALFSRYLGLIENVAGNVDGI